MRDIIGGIAVKELVAEWHMAIGRDIQAKDDLLAVGPEILVVAVLELDRVAIGGIVFADEGNCRAVIMNFIGEQFVNADGAAGHLGH